MIKTLLEKQIEGQGKFGIYFKLTPKSGVKILKNSGYLSKKINLKSQKNQDLIKEVTIGLFAKQLTKGIDVFKYKNKYYLGIVQTHFNSVPKDFTINELKNAKKEIFKNKVVHSDLHDGNLLWNPRSKKIKVIDFQPSFAYYIGDKREYYRVKNGLIKKLKEKTGK